MHHRSLESLRVAFRLLTPGERRRWLLLQPIGMLSSTVETAAAGSVFAMVAVLNNTSHATSLPLVQRLYAWVPTSWRDDEFMVRLFLGAAVVLVVLRVLLSYSDILYRTRVIARDQASFSTRMFRGYLSLPYALHVARNPADHVHRLEDAIQGVYVFILSKASDAVRTVAMMVGTLAVLLLASPLVTIVVLAVSGVVLGSTVVLLRRLNTAVGRRADDARRARQLAIREAFEGFKEIRMLKREDYFACRFGEAERALVDAKFYRALLNSTPRLLTETAFGLIMIALAAAGIGRYAGHAALLPLFGLYVYAAMRLLPGMSQLIEVANLLNELSVPLQRLSADVELMREEGDEGPAWTFSREIVLEDVAFAYAGRPALEGVNLSIRAGETIALAGRNGAGKSTLLHVIAGLLEASAGRVLVDGRDLATGRRRWLDCIGYVPQAVHLLDDTIRRNVALGIPDAEIDEVRVAAAIREAGLADDVAAMPAGLDSVVGQSGRKLSGGQRQRVIIARALYGDPPLLILDEATAALDRAAESAVFATLRDLHGTRTILLATHRPDLLRACDRILFLRDGRLVDLGSYDEIAARHGDFRHLTSVPVEPPRMAS